jgi:hypothetical protein
VRGGAVVLLAGVIVTVAMAESAVSLKQLLVRGELDVARFAACTAPA